MAYIKPELDFYIDNKMEESRVITAIVGNLDSHPTPPPSTSSAPWNLRHDDASNITFQFGMAFYVHFCKCFITNTPKFKAKDGIKHSVIWQ